MSFSCLSILLPISSPPCFIFQSILLLFFSSLLLLILLLTSPSRDEMETPNSVSATARSRDINRRPKDPHSLSASGSFSFHLLPPNPPHRQNSNKSHDYARRLESITGMNLFDLTVIIADVIGPNMRSCLLSPPLVHLLPPLIAA